MVKKRHKFNELRIIGGTFRSRKIYFPEIENLRPTPNRIRETLFNWLATCIQGASCLDMFAGSGALSFEAISRGADYCMLLDSSKEIINSLNENAKLLQLSSISIKQATFPYPCDICEREFDLVFVDPPFHKGLVVKAFDWLLHCQCLNKNALVYVESEAQRDVLVIPVDWTVLKDKTIGNVRYSLVRSATINGAAM